MTKLEKILTWLALAVALAAAIQVFYFLKPDLGSVSSQGFNSFSGGVSYATSTCNSTTTSIVSRNLNRQYLYLNVEGSATGTAWFGLGTATMTAGLGIEVSSTTGAFEMKSDKLYLGAVSCIGDPGAIVITYTEK